MRHANSLRSPLGPRWVIGVGATLVAVLTVLLLLAWRASDQLTVPQEAGRQEPVTRSASGTPVRGPSLSISSIKLNASLTAQGLRHGEINPDPGQVIWFTGNERVAPGESGISVVAGHVASGKRPDVFAKLSEIAVGDEVIATDKRGSVTTYTVTRAYTADKNALREDPAVWGDLSQGKRLALVTCDDALGVRSDGHRVANFVVIATA